MRFNPLCVLTCVSSVTFGTCLATTGLDNEADFKILANDGGSQDEFGTAVAVSGDLAIAGAPNDDDNGSNAGAAYIFRFNGSTWTQEEKLLASDGDASDEFGTSVAIADGFAMVGAIGDDDNGSDAGAVYVFSYDGSEWNQTQKLDASDGTSSDEFGIAVAMSDTHAIVGAHLDDAIGSNSGSAYAFRLSGTVWSEQGKILPSDGSTDDRFGMSISISNGVTVIGSRWHDGIGLNSGAAYVYALAGNTWEEEAKLEADDAETSDQYGWSVAIDQDRIVVGSRYDDDNGSASGSAYLYYFDGTVWNLYLKLLPSNGSSTDYFGGSVAISGDMLIVGAQGADDPINSGTAYVFVSFNGGDTWLEGSRIIADDAAINDALGISVAFDGNTLIAGAPFHDDDGSNSGAAYLAWPFMIDCNGNNIPDNIDIAAGDAEDCNENGVPDDCDIAGDSNDLNNNGVPDECDPDCNNNGYPDDWEIDSGMTEDCNNDDIPDDCNIADGMLDCNLNGIPDICDVYFGWSEDCNNNGVPDECDIEDGTSSDIDGDDIPDECEADCNDNGIPDHYEIKSGAEDCNSNGVPDECDIADGTSTDFDDDDIPDECEVDCNGNGFPDHWEIKVGSADDCNSNGVIDTCELDDDPDLDCNENNILDECDIADGTSTDDNGNGIPDECEEVPTCDGDADGDGVVNVVDLLAVIGDWASTDSDADLNDDGIVDVTDLLMVVGNWGDCP